MSSAVIDGPLHARGDADRPCELVEGPGQRWFGWGYHHTILAVRDRGGVKEVLLTRDKAPGVPGTKRGASWIAAWRVQRDCSPSRSEP